MTSGEVWARWNHKDPEPRPVYDWERSSLSSPYGSYNLELSPKTKSGGIPEGGAWGQNVWVPEVGVGYFTWRFLVKLEGSRISSPFLGA